jgi:hypothetical protein
METSAYPARTLRFGTFELDSRAGIAAWCSVHLQDQPFQILLLLLDRLANL